MPSSSTSKISTVFSYPCGIQWLKMRWHLLHGGNGIRVFRQPDGIWRIHADALSLQTAEDIIAGHLKNTEQHSFLKDDVKRTITRVTIGDASFIVKEYRRVFNASFSPDERGWLCGNRLRGTVRCLAWKRLRNKAFLVMEDAGAQSLDLSHSHYEMNNIEPKFRRAAQLMAMLHNQGIFHVDLKPSNFVTPYPDSPDDALTIIDCDDVRHYRHLAQADVQRNFIQFFGGLSYAIPNDDHRCRLARLFKDEYFRMAGLPPATFKNCTEQFLKAVKKFYPDRVEQYLVIQDILLNP